MKKIIILIISSLLLFPNFIKASEVDYDIEHYYINADILKDGDLKVTELIVLDGTFNGYIRDIVYKNSRLENNGYENNKMYNANNVEIIDISAKKVQNINFDTIYDNDFINLEPNQAYNQGYLESRIVDGKSYKMYFTSNNSQVAFKITYLINDVVVLHNDVAELYWTFIGSDYEDKINDLQIKINLPTKDNSDKFRIWAHGDLAGEINKKDNQVILANVKKLDAYSSVDIRTTFDTSLVDSDLISKKNNDNALDKILEVENKRAEIANQERKKMKTMYNLIMVLTIIWIIALVCSWIYIYIKFDKEYKSQFFAKYNREFIDDYNVEVIDYLFNKNITPNALSASVMNLIYKKNIKLEEIPSEKKKKEYTFYLINDNNTSDSEKNLLNFLFDTVGDQTKFTTVELKKYAKGTKTCESFSKSYTSWKNKVIAEAKNQGFFESQIKPKIYGSVFFITSILISVLSGILNVVNGLVYITNIIGIIFMIYTFAFTKRTKKGNDHYVKWKAFKNFLNDFATFDLKELPEIVLWERYMVYATVFGLADKVSKAMNVRIQEFENSGIYTGYTPTFTDWYVFNSINNSLTNCVHENTTAITRERANSISSSGSGFGGGFSSGGGFGGGGGGGHGF